MKAAPDRLTHNRPYRWPAVVLFTMAAFSAHIRAATPPSNDNFGNRTVLSGAAVAVSTYNNYATTESGEPSLGNRITTRSLWWSWTAPYTGTANFSTFGSDGPLALGIFVGDTLPSLSSLGISNVNPWTLSYRSPNPYSSFYYYLYKSMRGDTANVPVRSGETYQIVVAAPVSASDSSIGKVVLGINQPPAILSNGNVPGVLGQSQSYQISASNAPTEYHAQGLPPGLSLDIYTGLVSGTPTASGMFDTTISATNPGGTSAATVRFEIAEANAAPRAPELAYGYAVVDGTVGTSISSSSISAKNTPTEFTTDSLPPGLSWTVSSLGSTTASAYPSGTPTQAGIFKTTVRATNAIGSAEAYVTYRIREKPPLPVLQSAAVAYGKIGSSFSYSFYGTNMSGGTYECGTLPAGLQISTSGYISGTPTEAGAFEIAVKATNATGSTTGTLTLNIAPADAPQPVTKPVITSPGGATGNIGSLFSYAVNANTPGAQYSASGLPDGLSINPNTGLISGSPKATGNYHATITASTELGTSTSTLTLSIGSQNLFGLNSPAMTTGSVGKSFSYQLMVGPPSYPGYSYPWTSFKTTVPTAALPPGLSYTPSNYQSYPYYNFLGNISGTPTTPGIYRVPVTTTYQNLITAQAVLTIVVSETVTQAPVITSAASAQGKIGQSFSYYVSASNYAGSFAASGLPAGLSIDASTGAISGTPTQAGTFVVDLSATNAVGTGHAKLTIFIGPTSTGTFNSSAVYEGTVGISLSTWVSYSNPASGTPTYAVDGLPPGLQMSASGYISGTLTTAGTYPVTISATNAGGTTSIVQTFLIHAAPKPILTSGLMATGNVGASFSYSASSGGSVTYEFGQMPPGLSVSNGGISGTPTQAGTYEIPITATNAGGSTSGVLTLKIGPPVPPSLSTAASALAPRGQSFSKWFYPSNTTSCSVSGKLPAGITFDGTQNFQLSGTPTENGIFPLEITLNGPGGTITVPFTLYVAPPPLPVITSSLIADFSSSNYSNFYTDIYSTAFSAQGLPPGLTFYNLSSYAYAYNSGGFTSQGLVPATITATNFTGSSSAVVHFTSNSNLHYYDFGKAMAEGIVGEAFSYTLYSGSNTFMTGRAYSATNLPPGLAIDSATGKITGTPTTAGTYAVNITAIHSSYVSLSFTLMIRVKATPELPFITSNSVITATTGQSMSYWIYISGKATSYALDPVPPGLTFDSITGKLSGTPTAAGEYKVQIGATNAAGTRSANVLVQIAATPTPPIFSSNLSLQGAIGDSFSSYLSASGSPTSYAATGLPPGITLNTSTGNLSGTPTAAGTYLAQVQAVNAGGTTTAKLAFVILAQQSPVISSYAEQIGAVGDSFSYTISASHTPTSFTASNLPSGLSLDPTTGRISGTPTQAGDYLVPVTASNGTASGTATLTLRIQPRKPGWLSSAAAALGLVGEKLSISLYASQSSSTFSAENLPAGLSLSTNSATISGTPTAAGQYEIPVHVKRGDTETKSILSLTIAATPKAPPVITSALTAFVGSGYSYTLSATNRPTSFEVANLPDGITFNRATGVISGIPKTSGARDIPIWAWNAAGQSTVTVRLITIAPPTPIVTTSVNIYATASTTFTYPISLSTDTYDPFSYYYPYPPYPSYRPTALPPTVTARGLPPGMFFNPATQRIEGSATEPGDYLVDLTASTALSETTTRITLHVSEAPSSASNVLQISSSLYLNAFGAVGSTFSLNVFPIGLATKLVTTALPPGLSFEKTIGVSNNVSTLIGKITGTPTTTGVYPVKFTFSNAEQSASAIVTIVIPKTPELPTFSGYISASGAIGKSFSYYVGNGSTSSLNNAASVYAISGLPPGLSFDQKNGFISGTPTAVGRYVAPISLTNTGGTTEAKVVFTITDSTPGAPQLGANGTGLAASQVGYAGTDFMLTVASADSGITALTCDSLPTGWKLQKTSSGAWTLSSTPAEAGTFQVLLTATSSQGSTTIPLTLDIRQLDSSSPLPPPDPTPTPPPIAAPVDPKSPTLFVHGPSLILTSKSSLIVQGQVLHWAPGTKVMARWTNQLPWRQIRISRNGEFTFRVGPLPKGPAILTIRLKAPSGKRTSKQLKIFRVQS